MIWIYRKIRCLIFGVHRYSPCYEQRWRQHFKGTRRRHIKGRFECEDCGKNTKWMNQKDTDVFLEEKTSWLN